MGSRTRGSSAIGGGLSAILIVGIALASVACAGSGPDAPSTPAPADGASSEVMRPHWDQVCAPDREPLLLRTLDEVIAHADPAGLVEGLLPSPVEDDEAPWVELAVSYQAGGQLQRAHLLDHNVHEVVAREVKGAVTPHVRSRVRVLATTHLRIRATREPEPGLELLPALRCLPHVAHEDEDPPITLGGASVVGGAMNRRVSDGPRISVRLRISGFGALEEVHVLGGNRELLPWVNESLVPVRFDPALLNGMAVPGELSLTFDFRRRLASDHPDRERDL